MSIGMDFPPTADLRPVDEAAAWVEFDKVMHGDPLFAQKSPEEEARDIQENLEICALVWLSSRYGAREYDLDAMVEEIGEWREWPLDNATAANIQTFASRAIERDDHRPDQVETTMYLYMTRDC